LKLVTYAGTHTNGTSRPARGAWIETGYSVDPAALVKSRVPRGARGLKL